MDEENHLKSRAETPNRAVISVSELSTTTGLSAEQVLRHLLNNNIPFVYEASSQPGYLVADFTEVERDDELGGFVINSAMEVGDRHLFDRFLKPFKPRQTALAIIENGFSDELVFRIINKPKEAAFFDLPGVRITAKSLLVLNLHADRLFNKDLSERPIRDSQASNAPLAPSKLPCECCIQERANQSLSSVLRLFISKKSNSWKGDQLQKMSTQCGTFVELMNDPLLGALNRQMIWDYESKLRKMPANRYGAARRHKTNDAKELMDLAEKHDEPRLSNTSVERYLDSLSTMFSWAVHNMLLTHNPAKRAIERKRKNIRDQDERSAFNHEDLEKIFSAIWFTRGTTDRNTRGRFYNFQPHYYWLPLLGLYTGARLNELSQLYLTDLKMTISGIWYLDFNLDTPDKIDADSSDKSLKTVNSQRIIPLHPHLIQLGLSDYAKALKATGYLRLFPELKHDSIKGYGKPAGSWFNERFLGKQLSIPRDGKRTFHSFRHTFITALSESEVPDDLQS